MELMENPILTHVYAIYFFLAIMLLNLFLVRTQKDFVKLAKKLRFMTPMYHLSVAIVMYTGAIVAFYTRYFSLTVALMIATAIFLMVIEIKRHKKMKVIRSTDIELQKEFYAYSTKIYLIETAVLLGVFSIVELF